MFNRYGAHFRTNTVCILSHTLKTLALCSKTIIRDGQLTYLYFLGADLDLKAEISTLCADFHQELTTAKVLEAGEGGEQLWKSFMSNTSPQKLWGQAGI